MKKILFINDLLYGGGVENVLMNLINNLDKEKYEITLLSIYRVLSPYSYYNKNIRYKYIYSGIERYHENFSVNLAKKIYNRIRYSIISRISPRLLLKFIAGDNYDYVIAFKEGQCARLVYDSNLRGKKICWWHTDARKFHWSKGLYKNISEEIEVCKFFDKIVCVSESVKEAYISTFGDTDNLQVGYNAINEEEIIKQSKDIIQDMPLSSKFKIITVGRLTEIKGYNRLLQVHKKLIEEGSDYELWIVGDGEQRDNLERYISENNLENSVKLLGFKANPYKYMVQANLFVCSSIAEGFSTVVTEAIILGLPVVTVECSGMKEILGDSEYGLITKNNTEALYCGIKKILTDNQLYSYYKQKSKERSKSFKLKERIWEFEKLINENEICEDNKHFYSNTL